MTIANIKVYSTAEAEESEDQMILDLREWNEKAPTDAINIEFPEKLTEKYNFIFKFCLKNTDEPIVVTSLFVNKDRKSIELLIEKKQENKIQTLNQQFPFILEIFEDLNSQNPKFRSSFFRFKSPDHEIYQKHQNQQHSLQTKQPNYFQQQSLQPIQLTPKQTAHQVPETFSDSESNSSLLNSLAWSPMRELSEFEQGLINCGDSSSESDHTEKDYGNILIINNILN